jgi:hypothetical protein
MESMYYIGLDVHKRKISYCMKDGSGKLHAEGVISATRLALALLTKTYHETLLRRSREERSFGPVVALTETCVREPLNG